MSHPAVLAQLARRDESLLLLGHVSSQRALAIPRHLAGVARNISGLPYRVRAAGTLWHGTAARQAGQGWAGLAGCLVDIT